MRRAALFLLLAGCLSTPPRPGDGTPVDPTVCSTPSIKDDFEGPSPNPCGQGFEDGNATSMIERRGVLRMRPAANMINDASCTWNGFSFAKGTFVELLRPLDTGGSYTILQVEMTGGAVGISVLDEAGPLLQMSEPGFDSPIASIPYDRSEMRWLRLRPSSGRIAGEYSKDGEGWIELATTSVTEPPTENVEVSLNAGTYNPIAMPGVAEFDNFNVCP